MTYHNTLQHEKFPQPACGVAILTGLLALSPAALGMDLDREVNFNVPAQNLDSALLQFSEQTRIQIIVADDIRGQATNGVNGRREIQQALAELLEPARLRYRIAGEDVITVAKLDQQNLTSFVSGSPIHLAQAQYGASTSGTSQDDSVTTSQADASGGRTTANEESKGTLEEITVSARRREERLQTTPLSVASFGSEALENRNVTNLIDLDSAVPNISIGGASGAGTTNSSFYVRGIGQERNSIASEPGVGLYVDDVYIGQSEGGLLAAVDLLRLEVLRGPQGTLFGKNTIGGAIRFISAKPDATPAGSFEVTLGDYNRRDLKATGNVPLSDTVFLRLSGASTQRDGYVTRLIDDLETGDDNTKSLRAQLSWDATDTVSVNFAVDASSLRNNGASSVALDINPSAGFAAQSIDPATGARFDRRYLTESFYTTYGDAPNYGRYTGWGASATVDWRMGNELALKSITSYRTHEFSSAIDLDATPQDMFSQEFARTHEQRSQELQLSGKSFDSRLDWLLGAYYFYENPVENRFVVATRNTPVDRSEHALTDLESTSYALFGQGTYHLTQKLSTTVGMRWSTEEKKMTSVSTTMAVTRSAANEAQWQNVSPRIGLEYQWTDNLMTYISWASGFKAGSFNDRIRADLPNNGILPYDAETLATSEVGVRSDLLRSRLRVNATYFHSKYDKLQLVSLLPGATAPLVQNVGAAELDGVEFDVIGLLPGALTVNVSAAYTDAEYTDVAGAIGFTLQSPLNRTPKYSYSVGGEQKSKLPFGGAITTRVDWGWKDEYRLSASDPNAITQAAFGLLSSRVTYTEPNGRWRLALFGTNLTNRKYVLSGYNSGGYGFIYGEPGRPREFGLAFAMDF